MKTIPKIMLTMLLGIVIGGAAAVVEGQVCSNTPPCDYWCVNLTQCSTCLSVAPCWIEYGQCLDGDNCGQSTVWKACGFCES